MNNSCKLGACFRPIGFECLWRVGAVENFPPRHIPSSAHISQMLHEFLSKMGGERSKATDQKIRKSRNSAKSSYVLKIGTLSGEQGIGPTINQQQTTSNDIQTVYRTYKPAENFYIALVAWKKTRTQVKETGLFERLSAC